MSFKLFKPKAIFVAVFCMLASSVLAADFPSRDIRFIVPWPAGGGVDGISRKISQIAEKNLGQSIYVENIGGAITATGLMQMAKARPDGHTIGALTYDSIITLPRGKMVPGYSLDKMTLIARVTTEADAIVASKQSGFKNFDDIVSAAKAKPNTVRVGVAPKGSGPYLAVRRLEKMLDVKFNVISYVGSSSAETEALLSGELDAAISSLGDFNGIIQSGDALGLVELSSGQNPSFPDVPPIGDLGYQIETGSFIVLAAPKNTPKEAVEKIEAAFKSAYDSKAFQDWLVTVGVTPSWIGSDSVKNWANELQESTFKVMDELGL